ncbi:phosphatidate cytidylyltransferase [Sphingobacterium cellulitidis]|uniref:phosphatidate cytidylyltransferase n=1 Tax=Sphingobacterium cellulitidis TaxID=1768011 RepID=UPI000B940011|nr:phosphatidate cytidylyltransferase [Sphingobacterium cellulitidis]OYD45490.1 phosphatidate cytidylyltransferase [Sphingobacterium cellulitidis]
MKTRAITGFFFVVALVCATIFNQYVFTVFFALIGILSAKEFFSICSKDGIKPLNGLGTLTATVLAALSAGYFLGLLELKYLLLSIPFFSLLFISSLYLKREKPFHDIAYTVLGIWYATIPFLFFIGLGFIQGSFNPYIPMGFLIILWSNDTGAYLSGKAMGRTKLFERISPNKTWEGFIGGVILAMAVAFSLEHFFGSLSKVQWISIAAVIGIFGTLGDLVESMLKRSLGIKDSGQILPGHGGFLDRFDGLLIAAPLVYVLLTLL